ncbi:MAG: hypothetical protein MUF18_06935, partial [Fimbriiglobus sp.]|nr:hypothetical protein [Fimbriiglobus sp.]
MKAELSLHELHGHTSAASARVVVTAHSARPLRELSLGVVRHTSTGWHPVWHRLLTYTTPATEVYHPWRVQFEDGFITIFMNPEATLVYRVYRAGDVTVAGSALIGSVIQVLDAANGVDVAEWRGDLPLYGKQAYAGPSGEVVLLNERSLYIIDPLRPNSEPLKRTAKSRKHFTA